MWNIEIKNHQSYYFHPKFSQFDILASFDLIFETVEAAATISGGRYKALWDPLHQIRFDIFPSNIITLFHNAFSKETLKTGINVSIILLSVAKKIIPRKHNRSLVLGQLDLQPISLLNSLIISGRSNEP